MSVLMEKSEPVALLTDRPPFAIPAEPVEDEPTRLLKDARALLAGGWCKHHLAMDASGRGVLPSDPNATRFCALGAIMRARFDRHPSVRTGFPMSASEVAVTERLLPLIPRTHRGASYDVAMWNNDPERTQDEVLAVFDAAIEMMS